MPDLEYKDGEVIDAKEGESFIVEMTFKDPVNGLFKKSSITGLRATILNCTDHAVINDRDGEDILDVNGGSLDANGVLQLTLSAADNPILDETLADETHVLIIEWDWTDAASASQTSSRRHYIKVANVEESADDALAKAVDTLDLTGIKRVKTKHMEVEAFDPRIVQEAKEKENNPIPSFCGLHFCKGTPK